MIQLISKAFYPSIIDGSGFSTLALNSAYLRANVGDRVKAVYNYRLTVIAQIIDGTTQSFDFTTAGQCTRNFGSFVDDGFAIGDTFKYYNAVPTEIFTGVVTGVTGSILQFTVSTGSAPSTIISTNDVAFRGNTVINGIAYNFGLPLTTESDNYLNRVNNLGQLYIGNLGGPTLDVLQTMIPTNYNFETGELKVKSVTTGDPFTQEFVVEHIFVVLPYHLELPDYLTALEFGTVPPALQSGTLRYINSIYFCAFPGQQGSNKNYVDTGGGSGRWYGQNSNYLTPAYSITSITYDAGAGIDPNVNTHVTVVIHSTGTNINNDTRFYIFHSIAKKPVFEDTSQTLTSRLAFDYYNGKINDTGDGANSIILNVTKTAMNASNFTIEFDINNIDLDLLDVGDKFILGFGVADEDLTMDTSDMLMLYDYKTYLNVTDDIPGMVDFAAVNIYDYDKPISGKPYTGLTDYIKVWNQDELVIENSFNINKPALSDIDFPTLVGVKFHLEARKNDGTYFLIEGSEFDLPIVITRNYNAISYPVDNVHLSDQRNYNQLSGSDFRIIRLWSRSGPSDDITTYDLILGFKVNWQSWLQNLTSDPVFYDPSEPFNNLNQKTSNYSELNDYRIRAAITVSVTNEVFSKAAIIRTDYKHVSIPIIVRDYDDDGVITTWNTTLPTVQTFTADGLTDLNGNLLYNDFTLLKMTWTRAIGTAMPVGDMKAQHFIEPDKSPTCDYIENIGSDGDNIEKQLIPVVGQTDLKITKVSTTVIVTECLVDGATLTPGIIYNLSGRIWID